MNINKNNHDNNDICDIYSKKICDNCGKCLENEGIDIRAINIEDIAKSVDENKFIEEELKKALELYNDKYDICNSEINADQYSLALESKPNDIDYIDAFDNITYLDEIGLSEGELDELTDELYPGIRKLRINR